MMYISNYLRFGKNEYLNENNNLSFLEIIKHLDLKFFDSLDISKYHILSKINFLCSELITDIEIIKKIMPYLDVSKFKNINDLKNSFDEDLRQLVETRIKMTRQKLDNQNLQKLLKKRIEVTRSILDLNNTTQ